MNIIKNPTKLFGYTILLIATIVMVYSKNFSLDNSTSAVLFENIILATTFIFLQGILISAILNYLFKNVAKKENSSFARSLTFLGLNIIVYSLVALGLGFLSYLPKIIIHIITFIIVLAMAIKIFKYIFGVDSRESSVVVVKSVSSVIGIIYAVFSFLVILLLLIAKYQNGGSVGSW